MSKFSYLYCFVILAFGFVPNGLGYENGIQYDVEAYTLKKGDFSVQITNFGARIISILLPDKNGKLGDIVLGYNSLTTYLDDKRYFGAIVGRVANRIGGAEFYLDGHHYKLPPNEKTNMLHGGSKGFSQQVWQVKKYRKDAPNPFITLTYTSLDGEEGFPGEVVVSVTYTLLDANNLTVTMEGKTLNKSTPLNLAQHTYWNLGNHDSGDILQDQVQIFASHITPVVKSIPTGEITPVKGTPYDFLESKSIGSQIHSLQGGYDINYVIDDGIKNKTMKLTAIVKSKKSGREMKLYTDAPGVQFYTTNYMTNVEGKGGAIYQKHSALCLETQGFPDAVNHPNFPSTIVNPGMIYSHHMHFEFSIDRKLFNQIT